MTSLRWTLLISCLLCTHAMAFTPKPGDLLLAEEPCGTFCDAISASTRSIDHAAINHVAIVLDNPKGKPNAVIEATTQGVIITPLSTFLANTQQQDHQPRVWVARLKPAYSNDIPLALQQAKRHLGDPYNNTFSPTASHAFYCSQLVTDSFNHANTKGKTFHLQPMNFNDLATGQPIATWVNYFKQLKIPVPNGKPGSSPGGLSLDPHIDIVYRYFSLPAED